MKKKRILTALLVLLLLLALSRLDGESLLYSLKQIPLWAAVLLIGMQIVTQILVNLQWHQIAKLSVPSISFWDMMYINCQGALMDSITPGVKIGGEITRAVQISKIANCSGEGAASIVAVQKMFSLSALFFIQLFAVGYFIGHVPFLQGIYLQILIYAVLILFLLVFAGIFFAPNRIRAYLQAKESSRFSCLRKVQSFLLSLTEHVSHIRKNKRVWVMLFLLSVIIWLLYPVKMYILVLQVSPGVSLLYIGAIAFISYMVAMLPIFPGGLGGFEGTMTGLLLVVGLTVSSAAVITILFRFVTFWFVMLLSLAYIPLYKSGKKRAHSRNMG